MTPFISFMTSFRWVVEVQSDIKLSSYFVIWVLHQKLFNLVVSYCSDRYWLASRKQLRSQPLATSDVICGGRDVCTGVCFSQSCFDFPLPIIINRCSILIWHRPLRSDQSPLYDAVGLQLETPNLIRHFLVAEGEQFTLLQERNSCITVV